MEPEATGDAQEIQLLLFFPDICKEVGTQLLPLLEGCAHILCFHPPPKITYFAHTLTHAFAGAAAATASLGFQVSEMGEVGSSASVMMPPQQHVLLGSSVICPGSELALNFRMLSVGGVIINFLQVAIALRMRIKHH